MVVLACCFCIREGPNQFYKCCYIKSWSVEMAIGKSWHINPSMGKWDEWQWKILVCGNVWLKLGNPRVGKSVTAIWKILVYENMRLTLEKYGKSKCVTDIGKSWYMKMCDRYWKILGVGKGVTVIGLRSCVTDSVCLIMISIRWWYIDIDENCFTCKEVRFHFEGLRTLWYRIDVQI